MGGERGLVRLVCGRPALVEVRLLYWPGFSGFQIEPQFLSLGFNYLCYRIQSLSPGNLTGYEYKIQPSSEEHN